MILTIVLSLSGTVIAAGVATLLTGGGYQTRLGLISGNSGLAEGSTLATSSIAMIPLILYARKHSILIPRHWLFDWFCYGLIGASVLTAFGTFERTGIVAMAVLGLFLWAQSKHKVMFGTLGLAAAAIGFTVMSGDWFDRMSTISNFQVESSALTRIAVWMWTLQYAAAHPFGGGFAVYLLDTFRVPIKGTGDFLEINARAFHSIYFEVLGEQGIFGFGIFASMIACMFVYLRSVQRACRSVPADAWLYELARALTISAAVYLAGGAFVGIAFQPLFYYWFAGAICLHQYVARARAISAAAVPARSANGLHASQILPA